MDGWVDTVDHKDKILGFLDVEKIWVTGQRFLLSGAGVEGWGEREKGAVVYVGSQKGQIEALSEVRGLMT